MRLFLKIEKTTSRTHWLKVRRFLRRSRNVRDHEEEVEWCLEFTEKSKKAKEALEFLNFIFPTFLQGLDFSDFFRIIELCQQKLCARNSKKVKKYVNHFLKSTPLTQPQNPARVGGVNWG